jgi:hypothetical protein
MSHTTIPSSESCKQYRQPPGPAGYLVTRLPVYSDLAERYNGAALHPNYSTIPAAIMEYSSQKWL